jgi:hypothetical protein
MGAGQMKKAPNPGLLGMDAVMLNPLGEQLFFSQLIDAIEPLLKDPIHQLLKLILHR